MGDDITIGVTEIVNNIEVTAQPSDQIIDIDVVDNSDDVTLNITPTVVEININRGSSFARWGTILGNLPDQADLQNVLNLKADLVGGLVPASQLPSYVDDIVEVANYAALPVVGETGKIYLTLDNNKIFRWSGSVYIEIASDSGYVHIAGSETITGLKTFTETAKFDLNINLSKTGLFNVPSLYNTIGAYNTEFKFGIDSSRIAIVDLASLTAPRIYNYPDKDGIFAMTSDLHSAVTIGTANGLSLLAQELSLALSNATTTGALSSTDWSTFNNKQNALNGTGFVKVVGTTVSYDNSTYALDSVVVKLTGNQTITGQKTFNNASVGYGIASNNTSTGYGIYSNNTANGNGLYINNTSTGNGVYSYNLSTGTGYYSYNNSTGIGFYSLNSSTGNGIYSDNNSTGNGIFTSNSGGGNAIFSYNDGTGFAYYGSNASTGILAYFKNSSSGKNLVLNNTTAATGIPFTIQKNGVDKATISDSGGAYFAGNVGIGTTSPGQLLEVNGTIKGNSAIFNGFSINNTPVSRGTSANFTQFSNTGGDLYIGQEGNTNGGFFTGSLAYDNVFYGSRPFNFIANAVSRMYITSGGNVGIGTTSPASKLHVVGYGIFDDGTNGRLTFENASGQNDIYSTTTAFGAYKDLRYTANNHIFRYGSSEAMRITSGGNVGIGTTSPSYQLQLSTDSAAKPTSALWTIASDERIKENINSYTKGLNELLKINPITYDYNGLGGFKKGKGGVGIIAQEIAEILPDSVSSIKAKLNETDEEEVDILNFNGHELTYILINAVKELKAEIEILKNK